MPINKQALIRYKTIDQCLQNRFRKWQLEDLVEACSDALYEYEGVTKGVSLRTVQLDIQTMRSEKLGYNAPIVVVDKKYYTYSDKNYSITNIPLTGQDLGTLTEVVEVLQQFKGFGYMKELTGMISRLEDKVQRSKSSGKSFIRLETNDLLKGLEYIDPIHKAIQKQQILLIRYQSFTARQPNTWQFHPYLLKEYRNRWFLLGADNGKRLMNLALDRIQDIKVLAETYRPEEKLVDTDTFFDDLIGVTRNIGQRPSRVVLWVAQKHAPYVLTKPIHSSQRVLREQENGILISIEVVLNFELEREILGFGEEVKVLSPRRLQTRILHRLNKSLEMYSRQVEKDYVE